MLLYEPRIRKGEGGWVGWGGVGWGGVGWGGGRGGEQNYPTSFHSAMSLRYDLSNSQLMHSLAPSCCTATVQQY